MRNIADLSEEEQKSLDAAIYYQFYVNAPMAVSVEIYGEMVGKFAEAWQIPHDDALNQRIRDVLERETSTDVMD